MRHTGLVAPWHVGSSQTRARTRVPCIGRQILNHCATREAPRFAFLNDLLCSHTELMDVTILLGDTKDKEGVVYVHNAPTYPPRKAMQATERTLNFCALRRPSTPFSYKINQQILPEKVPRTTMHDSVQMGVGVPVHPHPQCSQVKTWQRDRNSLGHLRKSQPRPRGSITGALGGLTWFPGDAQMSDS